MCFGLACFEALVEHFVGVHFASFFASRFVGQAVLGYAVFVCFEALCGAIFFRGAGFDASIEDCGADGFASLFAGRLGQFAALQAIGEEILEFLPALFLRNATLQTGISNL
jgi:hypothetical protein